MTARADKRKPVSPPATDAIGLASARRRLPAGKRRQTILDAAAELFAEEGFGASTRTLAARLGITQAALYKHFQSKDAIVTALFARGGRRGGRLDWHEVLSRERPDLIDRLGDAYATFVNGIDASSMRLFVRAGLDRHGQPGRRGAVLTAEIFQPVVDALRRDASLPPLDERPMQHEEREVAMALHGAVVFLAVRKHVYRMPMPDDLSAHARRLVRLWLPGALAELRELHRQPADEAVPQLTPGDATPTARPDRVDRRNR